MFFSITKFTQKPELFILANYRNLSLWCNIKDNLTLLQKIDPSANAKATEFIKNEQLRHEKYEQFKVKIPALQKQFKEWSISHAKQMEALKSIKDAYHRELETYPVYQDFQKTAKTVGESAADKKYRDQISELQTKLAQKYFGGLDQLGDVFVILDYFTGSIPGILYCAEWLLKTPQYINGGDALEIMAAIIEYSLKNLSDMAKKISIQDKKVTAK